LFQADEEEHRGEVYTRKEC